MTLDSRTTNRSDLEGKHLPELQQLAQTLGVSGVQRLRKGDLIDAIISKSGQDKDSPATNGEVHDGKAARDAVAKDSASDVAGSNGDASDGGESREPRGGGSSEGIRDQG